MNLSECMGDTITIEVQKIFLGFCQQKVLAHLILISFMLLSPYDEFEFLMNYKSEIHECLFKIIFEESSSSWGYVSRTVSTSGRRESWQELCDSLGICDLSGSCNSPFSVLVGNQM